jgi:hypothetical protein
MDTKIPPRAGFLYPYESPVEMSRKPEADGPRRGRTKIQQDFMSDRLPVGLPDEFFDSKNSSFML